MLFNLIIRLGDSYNSKVIFQGQALTYEQCDFQIVKARQSIKEQYGNEMGDNRLIVEMTSIEWVKLQTE